VPIIVGHVHWMVELSQAITIGLCVTQVATSTADLVRTEKQISHTEIGDIMNVGGYILEPYSQTPLQITLRNVTSSPADATTTKHPDGAPIRVWTKPKPARLLQHHQVHPAQPAHRQRQRRGRRGHLWLQAAGGRWRNVPDRGLRDDLSQAAEPSRPC
jgi:hypothetical protein